MSIFGKLDATSISSNPFHVEAGEYFAEVTVAEFTTVKQGKNQGRRQLHIEYVITDPESQYVDSKVQQYMYLPDENMTREAFELLPADEQASIRRNNAKVKQTLCGDDNNREQRPGLGVDPEDLNDPDWDIKTVVGTRVKIVVSNGGSSNEYVNVRWVNRVTE